MRVDAPTDFAQLVGFDLSRLPAAENEAHGTTVLALRFDEGVVMLADRRATMGSLIMYDKAEKIIVLDKATVVAISGAFARSIEVCRYLRHAFKFYERRNLYEISAEGKLMEISKALSGNLSSASTGVGVFLPIAASYDRRAQDFGIYFFDLAGARFRGAEYACAGSGSERIRGVFDYITRSKGPWSDRGRDEVLLDGLRMLDIASDLDSATGGLRKYMPSVCALTSEGVENLDDEAIRPLADEVLSD
ncbi:MAG: proteasome subunit alpha [Armatimonadetes bacterium]|nr:proteasome subunit alpha [Armatimonadota bacterium]